MLTARRNPVHWQPQRMLHRLASGTHVLLADGSVWTKALCRWMPAGWVIPRPLSGQALLAINGCMPVVLREAGGVAA